MFIIQLSCVSVVTGGTCRPCADDCRALTKRWVSQGARSPMSTCLLWSLGGTGSTLQSGSLRICVVLSRKLGRSAVRSKWAFLEIRNCRTWVEYNNVSTWETCLPCIELQKAFLAVLPDPPPHQMWISAPGGKGGSVCWKVTYILPLDLGGVVTAPCWLDPVDNKESTHISGFIKVNLHICRKGLILVAPNSSLKSLERFTNYTCDLIVNKITRVMLGRDTKTEVISVTIWQS